MNLRDLEKAVRKLKLECPNPIVRVECSSKFYKALELILEEMKVKPAGRMNNLGYGSLLSIPVIEVPSQIEPFRLVRVDDVLGESA